MGPSQIDRASWVVGLENRQTQSVSTRIGSPKPGTRDGPVARAGEEMAGRVSEKGGFQLPSAGEGRGPTESTNSFVQGSRLPTWQGGDHRLRHLEVSVQQRLFGQEMPSACLSVPLRKSL